LVVTDLKRMLIWSSFSSSSWIYLSCFVSIVSLLFYFLIYSILLIGFMIFTNWLAKSFTPFSKKVLMLILFSIIGLPPFPLFFAKLMIILSTLILFSHFYFISIFILFLLIFSVILILLYFRAIINLILF
jgi:formate hydrogenlyase subunit 3/multisubunit Na+/H+ antiporter MnhD subunit